jgi:hypothetical protein
MTFSVVGTLVFEEGGIAKEDTQFGKEYIAYRKEVNAFIPSLKSIQIVTGLVSSSSKKEI